MLISVVIPLYNEVENLADLYAELQAVLCGVQGDWEIVFVDDGSVDGTAQALSELGARDNNVKVVRFRRNFGQTAAMAAGFDHARGDIVIPMDGDLQNDPADIPRLIAKVGEGFDVVSGWRKSRKDRFLSRKLPSVLANRLISRMTGVHLHDYGCTLKAYRREVLEQVSLYGELHRFVPALASLIGISIAEIPVNHRERQRGQSKYGLDRTLRVVLDLITVKFLLKYSTKPMQLFGKWAFWTFLFGCASGATLLYMKVFEGFSMNRNPLLVLTAFLLFSSMQFIMLGLLGELVTRVYHETQSKPIYVVKDTINVQE